MKRVSILIMLALTIFAIPRSMFFQGMLKDDTGELVTGSHSVRFEIIDEIGTVLWSETQDIEFRDGLFVAELGRITPISTEIWDIENVYTRVFLDGEEIPELTPLITVPYSFRSLTSDTSHWANGVEWDSISGIPDGVPGLIYARHIGGAQIRDSLIFEAGENIEITSTGNTLTFNAAGNDTDWIWTGADIHNGNSGNVGIGTALPENLLHVSGEGRFDGPLTVGEYTLPDVDGDSASVLITDGYGNVEWGEISGDGWGRDTAFTEEPVTGNGSTVPIGLDYGQGLYLHGGNLTVNAGEGLGFSGNILINTGDLDPDDDLTEETVFSGDVNGVFNDLQITEGVIVPEDLAASGIRLDFDFLTYSDSVAGFRWINVGDIADLDWAVDGENLIAIPTGSVGIGTDVPTHKLHVEGAAFVNGPLTIGEYTLPYTEGADGQILKNIGGTILWTNDERAEGGGDGNDMVKADSGDPEEGYLSGKVDGTSIGVDLTGHHLEVMENGIETIHIADGTIREVDLHSDEFLLWDRDTTDDLSKSTVFSGDVEGVYDSLQIVPGAVREPEIGAVNEPSSGHVLGYDGDSLIWVAGAADNDWTGAGTGNMYASNLDDNIGIGTDMPEERLHVAGNVYIDGNLRIEELLPIVSDSILVVDESGNIGWMNISDFTGSGGGLWQITVTTLGDTVITPIGNWGLARFGNILHGTSAESHVNLGVSCVTGAEGENRQNITVSGGFENTASGASSTISGGLSNIASENGGVIGGGLMNTVSGQISTIAGGGGNIASGNSSTITGGTYNIADGAYATVGGGTYSEAGGDFSTVGGGSTNSASGYGALISGGALGRADGNYSTVSGGYRNSSLAIGTSISGGSNNSAMGDYAGIGGGFHNTAGGRRAFVAGGSYLTVGERSFGFRGGTSGVPTSIIDVSSEPGTFHIVDTRFHFNYDNDDADFRIDGLLDNAFFMRAEDNRIGFGTDEPTASVDIEGTVAIGDTLDMEKNQIKNMVIENRTDNPESPAIGQIWMRVDY